MQYEIGTGPVYILAVCDCCVDCFLRVNTLVQYTVLRCNNHSGNPGKDGSGQFRFFHSFPLKLQLILKILLVNRPRGSAWQLHGYTTWPPKASCTVMSSFAARYSGGLTVLQMS